MPICIKVINMKIKSLTDERNILKQNGIVRMLQRMPAAAKNPAARSAGRARHHRRPHSRETKCCRQNQEN